MEPVPAVADEVIGVVTTGSGCFWLLTCLLTRWKMVQLPFIRPEFYGRGSEMISTRIMMAPST